MKNLPNSEDKFRQHQLEWAKVINGRVALIEDSVANLCGALAKLSKLVESIDNISNINDRRIQRLYEMTKEKRDDVRPKGNTYNTA